MFSDEKSAVILTRVPPYANVLFLSGHLQDFFFVFSFQKFLCVCVWMSLGLTCL